MDYFSICSIAVGLAMDAFAVSVSDGALSKSVKISYALKLSFFFGFFQLIMPVTGWLFGKAGESFIKDVDHWVAFGILSVIGFKLIADYINEIRVRGVREKHNMLSLRTMLILALATSIDALATGIILPSAAGASSLTEMFTAVFTIGLITFIISLFGIYLGKFFGYVLSVHSGLFGGVILLIIGSKILIEHLVFNF